MQVSTFFIPLRDTGEEQERLNGFRRGHRILRIDKAFEGMGWAIFVEWLEDPNAVADWKRKPRTDWREKLAPDVFERFVKLRERRKKIAAEDGVPPYMVMTDAQMAETAGFECLTSDTFRRIEGFGEARIAKYASRLLEGGNQT